MTKLKAFATHLGISLIIFLVILALIVFSWYPPPFFSHDGGWQGIRIIAAVDLILGPVLTLIVYKKGKPRLVMDLTIIALVQLAALTWGVWAVYTERPVAIVFSENRFNVIPASTLKNLGYAESDLKKFGDKQPVWIYSKLPDNIDEAQKIRIKAYQEGKPVYFYTEYYTTMHTAENINAIVSKKIDVEKWAAKNKEDQKSYEAFKMRHEKEMSKIAFFSWKARYGKKVIALQDSDLTFIDTLDIELPVEAEF